MWWKTLYDYTNAYHPVVTLVGKTKNTLRLLKNKNVTCYDNICVV